MRKDKGCVIEFDNGVLYIKPMGEIDHHSAGRTRESADTAIYEKRPKKIIFDLSSVDFMDSSGLGLILGRYTKACGIKSDFIVKNPSKNVMRIINLAGAERILKIERGDLNE